MDADGAVSLANALPHSLHLEQLWYASASFFHLDRPLIC